MSYRQDSAFFSPTSPQHRWDTRDRDRSYQKNDYYPKQHSYPTPPSSASFYSSASDPSRSPALPPRYPALPPRPSRNRWPPSPWAEEERKSLARERNPSVTSNDSIPSRGTQNQYPIILEADASSESESEDMSSKRHLRRTDSSSTDSSGPRTPRDASLNSERRFVIMPHEEEANMKGSVEDDRGEAGEDQPRRGSYIRMRPGTQDPEAASLEPDNGQSKARNKSPAGHHLTVDPTPRHNDTVSSSKKGEPLPYTGPRQSKPYSYSPSPTQTAFPTGQQKVPEAPTQRGRPCDLRPDMQRPDSKRTQSGTFPQNTIPISPRYQSAVGVPGETVRAGSFNRTRGPGLKAPFVSQDSKRTVSPLGSSVTSRPAIESDSEYTESDSDIGPDDLSPPRRRRRESRYSMSGRQIPRDDNSPKIEPMRKPLPHPINTAATRPTQSLGSAARQPAPASIPRSPSSTNLTPTVKMQEMRQKMPDHQIRQTSLGSPFGSPFTSPPTFSPAAFTSPYRASPPPSPNPDLSRFTSPQSSGQNSGNVSGHAPGHASLPESRQNSRPNSRSGSRPSTPTYPAPRKSTDVPADHSRVPYPTQRQGTLEMPSESHFRSPVGHLNRPPSRPQSPLNSPPGPHSQELKMPSQESYSREGAPRSRHTSPLPSPNLGAKRSETTKIYSEPAPLDPRSKTFPVDGSVQRSREPTQSVQSPQVQSSQTPRYNQPSNDAKARHSTDSHHSAHGSIDSTPRSPAVFKPNLRKRPSAGMPNLPRCPRPGLSEGYEDWSTLPGHPYFDVCPTCRAALEDGGFYDQFVPSPKRPHNHSTRCDMSNTWIRMAWILLLQDRARDRSIVNSLTAVHSNQQPCPGRDLQVRNWHRVYDPDTGRYVSNFDVCPACVKSLETLFPALRGVFSPVTHTDNSQHANQRTCDLRTDSHRFPKYVDLLENIATQADYHRRGPNMHHFIQLARKMAAVTECAHDTQLLNVAWHYPQHAPDFTVCEECYSSIVLPYVQNPPSGISPSDNPANMLNRALQLPPPSLANLGLSCQLYSPRMREIFKEAVKRGDVKGMREKALARVAKERELQRRHREIQNWDDEDDKLEEGRRLVREWARWA